MFTYVYPFFFQHSTATLGIPKCSKLPRRHPFGTPCEEQFSAPGGGGDGWGNIHLLMDQKSQLYHNLITTLSPCKWSIMIRSTMIMSIWIHMISMSMSQCLMISSINMEKMMVSHDAQGNFSRWLRAVRWRSQCIQCLGAQVAADFDAWGTRMISDDGIFDIMWNHLPVQ